MRESASPPMRLFYISQLIIAVFVAMAAGAFSGWQEVLAILYGAMLGIMITLLTRRSTDRALQAAVVNPRNGVITMFSGFALRYAVAILGLLAGFKVLQLPVEPMIAAFILMIVVQVLAMTLLGLRNDKKREA